MRLPFCILKLLGDILDDGELVFLEAAQTLDAARRRIETLSESPASQYVIYNKDTGERLNIAASPSVGLTLGTDSDIR